MSTISIIDPVTRLEGHLKIELEISQNQVMNAKVKGMLYRGFESILRGQAPENAPLITQRICGVCPVSHGQASIQALENVSGWIPDINERHVRDLILGANFIQSHILHFYLLSLMDFTPGPNLSPWNPSWDVDLRPGLEGVMQNLPAAVEARRQAHEMGAIFCGKMPHAASYAAGGTTAKITSKKVEQFKNLLSSIIEFIETRYIPDVETLQAVYPDYYQIGVGPENLLAFGAFHQDDNTLLFQGGTMQNNEIQPLNSFALESISEHVTNSWYAGHESLSPRYSETIPEYPKEGAYSWVKAPRLFDQPFELGPLARMKINNLYSGGISTMDRHMARSREALVIAKQMDLWLENISGGTGHDTGYAQAAGFGLGLTEAPRGALGHWVTIGEDQTIANYQIITPTCWNASPKSDDSVNGPLEQALIGTYIEDKAQPIEAVRIIHSFDPCLACAIQ